MLNNYSEYGVSHLSQLNQFENFLADELQVSQSVGSGRGNELSVSVMCECSRTPKKATITEIFDCRHFFHVH